MDGKTLSTPAARNVLGWLKKFEHLNLFVLMYCFVPFDVTMSYKKFQGYSIIFSTTSTWLNFYCCKTTPIIKKIINMRLENFNRTR